MRNVDRFLSPSLMRRLGALVELRLDGRERPVVEDGSERWRFDPELGDEDLMARLRSGETLRGVLEVDRASGEIRFVADVAERIAARRREARQAELREAIVRHLAEASRRMVDRHRWSAVAELAKRAGVRHAVATKTVLSGLYERGGGTGTNVRTVGHVVTLDPISRGRLSRAAGDLLCGAGDGSYGTSDGASGHELCRSCRAALERLAGHAKFDALTAAMRSDEAARAADLMGHGAAFAVAVGAAQERSEVHVFVAADAGLAQAAAAALGEGKADRFGPVPVPSDVAAVLGAELQDAERLVEPYAPPAP